VSKTLSDLQQNSQKTQILPFITKENPVINPAAVQNFQLPQNSEKRVASNGINTLKIYARDLLELFTTELIINKLKECLDCADIIQKISDD